MEIKFKLKRKAEGWLLTHIKKVVDTSSFWYSIPKDHQLLNERPVWLRNLVNAKLNVLIRKDKLTFGSVLRGDELDYFLDENQNLQIDSIRLQTEQLSNLNSTADSRVFKREVAKLKFNPLIDDASEFRDRFIELFQNKDDDMAKLHLQTFIPLKDKEHFQQYLSGSFIDLLDAFYLKYENQSRSHLESLKSAGTENGIENCINKKFEYADICYKGLPFKTKLLCVIDILPSDLKQLIDFTDQPVAINSKQRLIDYLNIKFAKSNNQQENTTTMEVVDNIDENIRRQYGFPEFLRK